jgi:hypothetical protein
VVRGGVGWQRWRAVARRAAGGGASTRTYSYLASIFVSPAPPATRRI